MSAFAPDRDERGQALVIALVFMSLFGLLIALLLSQAFVNMRTGTAVESRVDKQLAADGGIEYGLWRSSTATATDPVTYPAICPNPSAVATPVTGGPATINGKTVTVDCRNLAGRFASPAAQRWSIITTSTAAGSLTTDAAPGDPITVTNGDVHVAGGISLNRNLEVRQGDVQQAPASCAGPNAPNGLTIPEPDTWSCPTSAVATPDVPHALPLPAPTVIRPSPTILPNCGGNSWRILHPGKYTNVPTQGFDLGERNYLESGVYYLEDVPVTITDKIVVGGRRPATEADVLADGCPSDPIPANGTGVIIILGGSSSITLANSTAFELFTRTPQAPDGSTPGISIATVPLSAPVNYKPSTGVAALTVSSSATEVAIHGLVYAPVAPVTVFARPIAPLLGGVVSSTLRIRANAGATGSLVGVAADGRRTLLLTSTAATPAASGEIAITEQAVVKVANDPARTATVRSWRAL